MFLVLQQPPFTPTFLTLLAHRQVLLFQPRGEVRVAGAEGADSEEGEEQVEGAVEAEEEAGSALPAL